MAPLRGWTVGVALRLSPTRLVFFRPFGADPNRPFSPPLAPWAVFFRRFAAGEGATLAVTL